MVGHVLSFTVYWYCESIILAGGQVDSKLLKTGVEA
ncbi:unnamed protein product [Brassica oleracea var. botrytis]